MKTKNLWKYALSGLLLASMPLCAQAQTPSVTVPNKVTTTRSYIGDVDVGVLILAGNNTAEVDFTDATGTKQVLDCTAGAGTITLQGVDLQGVNYVGAGDGVTGIAISMYPADSLSQKIINTGDINVVGNSTTGMAGFYYETDNANPVAFDGVLKIGDVNVANSNAAPTGWIYGVAFKDINGNPVNIAGDVTAGNINVRGNLDAIGFDVNGLVGGANATLGNIDVNSGGVNFTTGVNVGTIGDGGATATGKSLSVGNVNVTSGAGLVEGISLWNAGILADGSLTAGNINVNATAAGATADGIWLGGVAPGANFNVGEIHVESAGNATGIELGGPSAITVTKDIIAKSNAPAALGIGATGINADWVGGTQNVTIDTTEGDVQISGIADTTGANWAESIWLGGNGDTLTITGKNKHTNKGQVFVVGAVENVNWGTDANYVDGSDFDSFAATTHRVATGKTVVIDGSVSTWNSTYTVGSNADNNSAGTLVVQKLDTSNGVAAGNVAVHNGFLGIDGSTGSVIGTLTIGNNNAAAQAPATVALYGNTLAGNVGLALNGAPILGTNAVVDPTTKESVLSLSTITEYKLNAANTAYVAQNRKRASLADGFLLPASIHRYNTGWEATRDHLISGGQRVKVSKGILGQAPCDPCEPVCDACESVCDACEPVCEPCEPTCDDDAACNPCDPCGSKGGLSVGRSVWVNYIGRSNSYQSSYSNIGIENGDWEIGTDGVQVGLDLFKTSNAQLGLLFGYEGSKATLRSDRLDADDVYFGAYAARVFRNGVDFRAVYNYGSQDYKLNRLDPGLGLDWHSHNSAFDGNTHEVNLELGKRVFANRRWSYRPVIGFDLLVNNWDAAQEDGNLATAIAYDGVDYTQAFLRIGSDLKFVKGGFVFNSGLYYSYDLNDNELKTKVFARDGSKLGYNKAINSTLYGSKLGRSVLTFNVGGSLALSKRTSVFGGFTGDNSFDRDGDKFQSNGYVGLQYQW
jgi:hypothetical protein